MTFKLPQDVPGYGTPETWKALYDLGRRVPRGQWIVELGTFYGQGAICLAQGARDGHGARVLTIDHYRGEPDGLHWAHVTGTYTREETLANLARYQLDGVMVAQGQTWSIPGEWWAFGERVGALIIDADHDKEAAYLDFSAWDVAIDPAGVVVFDDATFPGVAAAIDRIHRDGRWFVSEHLAGGRLAVLHLREE